MNDRWGAFVAQVAERRFGDAFPMLAAEDPVLDSPGAPAIRRRNLAHYLAERTAAPPVLLVGEAMGWAGGRFSGIAFTAERTLLRWGPPYEPSSLRPEGYAEQSGSIVHGLLETLGAEHGALLWNVVPAHPHRQGAPLTNRLPREQERRAGGEVLAELVALVAPLALIPVGRTAERTLAELGIAAEPAVRHPANAGAARFRIECAAAFDRLGLTTPP